MECFETKNLSAGKVQYKKIGNTMFEFVSHYGGEKTYMDIVKDMLQMEINRTYNPQNNSRK
jgi:ribosomal protein S3AE